MEINTIHAHHRILLLQGPMSFFFKDFADWLESQGRYVRKINFNGGDWLFFRDARAVDFTGHPSHFDAFLRTFLTEKHIDAVFCFGDCRLFHRIARKATQELNIAFYVFEEGYVRPHYVTLEKGGVNGYSSLPKNPDFYRALPKTPRTKPLDAKRSNLRMCWYSFLYYYAGRCLKARYPYYPHHKEGFASWGELIPWMIGYGRKLMYRCRDWFVERDILQRKVPPYFVAILQVHNDSQLLYHSHYQSVPEFIREVLQSFARYAESDCHLYIKHHPMDLGHCHYGECIDTLTRQLDLSGRVHYVREIHVPTLLRASKGVVTINSTVGLSALYHGRPVKALGNAIYDMADMTFQGSLDAFWTADMTVDKPLCRRFIQYVIEKTQLNGAFLGKMHFFDDTLDDCEALSPADLARGEARASEISAGSMRLSGTMQSCNAQNDLVLSEQDVIASPELTPSFHGSQG